MKENKVYLSHILDCISHIQAYTEGMDEELFNKNFMVQDAVVRNFQIIGEATKRITSEFKMSYSNIPWKKMTGMRDKLIHDYFQIDLETVWSTIVKDIPPLQRNLEEIHSKL
jgi:uncharacterized protein with HEPN domain